MQRLSVFQQLRFFGRQMGIERAPRRAETNCKIRLPSEDTPRQEALGSDCKRPGALCPCPYRCDPDMEAMKLHRADVAQSRALRAVLPPRRRGPISQADARLGLPLST